MAEPLTCEKFKREIQRITDSLFNGCPVADLGHIFEELNGLIASARTEGLTLARDLDEIEMAWQPEAFRMLDAERIPRLAYGYMFEDQLTALGLEPEWMPQIDHSLPPPPPLKK